MRDLEDAALLAEEVGPVQRIFRDDYRRIIGVPPEARQEFRTALERIAEGSSEVVQHVMEEIRRRAQSSGFRSGEGV